MPGQLVQGVLFFRDRGVSEGWGEAIFATTDIPSMFTTLETLIPLRATFLSRECEIHASRASNVGGTKASSVRKYAIPTQGAVPEDTNEVGDCINYFYKAGTLRRQLTFRGVRDSAIQGSQLGPNGPGTLSLIDSYCNNLITLGAQIKTIDGGNESFTVASLANSVAGGPIIVTTDLPHGFANGDLVKLTGIRGFPYLRGQWRIGNVTSLAFTLIGSQRYNINLVGAGVVRQVTYEGVTGTSFGFDQVGFRQTGRPFGLLRGRAPAKVLHH